MKTAEAARMSLPAVACAHGKSSDLTIWVTPHQEVKTRGPERGERRNMWGDHLFPTNVPFFHLPLSVLEGGRGGGRGRVLVCPLSFSLSPSYLEQCSS